MPATTIGRREPIAPQPAFKTVRRLNFVPAVYARLACSPNLSSANCSPVYAFITGAPSKKLRAWLATWPRAAWNSPEVQDTGLANRLLTKSKTGPVAAHARPTRQFMVIMVIRAKAARKSVSMKKYMFVNTLAGQCLHLQHHGSIPRKGR